MKICLLERVNRYHTDYGLTLVKADYGASFCPDAEEAVNEENSCNSLNNAAISMGLTLTGMWVWELMKSYTLYPYITRGAILIP